MGVELGELVYPIAMYDLRRVTSLNLFPKLLLTHSSLRVTAKEIKAGENLLQTPKCYTM